jgi:hypothetical protein
MPSKIYFEGGYLYLQYRFVKIVTQNGQETHFIDNEHSHPKRKELILLLFLLLLWRYSPGWALASITIRLQTSRYLAQSLPFVYSHLFQALRHIIQPSRFWSSSASCCIQLSVQKRFGDCCVLHSFYVTKPSYSLAFNKPDNILPNRKELRIGKLRVTTLLANVSLFC